MLPSNIFVIISFLNFLTLKNSHEIKKQQYKLQITLIRRWNIRLTWVWYKTNGLVSTAVVSKLKKEGEGSWSHLTQCLGFKYSVSLLIFSPVFFFTGSAKIRWTSADLHIFFFFSYKTMLKVLGKCMRDKIADQPLKFSGQVGTFFFTFLEKKSFHL